ncbi:FAD-dependent oxidoreductase [Basilea psittacipulmonis]|uniref:D-amino-acid oxidase n=1 Tax=Basilea psittacipulmonis DSM 24701 TaxID=1072685 RepID=A0A077DE05_9BURK|nr:FAD-dependent oxidoreductase [Basilea psittacipulmonis]AIL33080.1 thiamine biosynthesis protein thio [Basilea psittacipulmonis DSM 24701]
MKVGIAGAGLLGRLLAFNLCKQGHDVTVYDPASHYKEHGAAGFTAAGMLSHVAELETGDDEVFQHGLRSLELWKQMVPELKAPVELNYHGSLLLAHRGDEGSANRLVSLLEAKCPADQMPEKISIDELKSMEPDIKNVASAWLLKNEGHIHTPQAMEALAVSAKNAIWQWNTKVTRLTPHYIHIEQEKHEFDWVFDTRGVGARDIPCHDPSLISCRNVRGVRGETYWLQLSGLNLTRPIRLLHPRYRVYIVPRKPDIVVIGASEIESEDRSPVSVRTTLELLAAAYSVLPELAEARIIHTETNLRPALANNFPRIEHEKGLTRINGLFRHGWLIGPSVVEKALNMGF